MRTYEKYKDSGISWIGKVPEDWSVRRIKYIGYSENGLTYSPNDITKNAGVLVLRSSNIQNNRLAFDDNVYVKAAPKKLMLHKGDIIICSRNGSVSLIGKSALIEEDMNATFGAFMLRFHSKYNSKYIYYLVSDAISKYKGLFATTTINQLTKSAFASMHCAFAPNEDQEAIANYLDKKTEEIDKIIAEREKKIELLNELKSSIISRAVTKGINPHAKMKDSGIDWIGKVPEDWITTKLKYLLHLHNGRAYSQEELLTEGKYKVLRVGNFFTNDKWYYSNFELEPVKYCNKGDLLYAWSASFGPYIWDQDKTIYHYHIWKVTLEPSYNKKYAYYMLSALTEYKKSDVHGSTMVHVTMESMNNSFITLPPFQEQCEIARYLDEKLKRLSEISNDIISEISLLREYKQSLISEVVTGKRKVIV
jgi:type I restriction enzyme S subunit